MFIIFHSGERAKNKILKICEAFGANRYPFTDDLGKQFQMINEVCSILTSIYVESTALLYHNLIMFRFKISFCINVCMCISFIQGFSLNVEFK